MALSQHSAQRVRVVGMELFLALALLAVAAAASLMDIVRHSRANPDQKIPWLGNPPRLPKWWFVPRLVMILAITGGINLLWRAAGIAPWLVAVIPAVIILVPAICVLVFHNRRVQAVVDPPPSNEELDEVPT